MKKFNNFLLVAVPIVLVVVGTLFVFSRFQPLEAQTSVREYVTLVSSTQANSQVTFGFNARVVHITNEDSSNEIFVTFASKVATTSKFRIPANGTFTLEMPTPNIPGIGVICSTGETATVRVGAW